MGHTDMTGGIIMCQIAVSIPEEVLFDTKMSQEEAGQLHLDTILRAAFPLVIVPRLRG